MPSRGASILPARPGLIFAPLIGKLICFARMQLVSAFSRPQTVPAAPAVARKPSLWILNSWRDLVLYVCTPLLLVPMFIAAQARWSAEDIYLFVAAFGAMGHHLPGMMRAYGDRALFRRFKWRFILAPIFLLAICTSFFFWDLKGIVLIAFLWGVWHGMMQTYGFCRIYDAKVGSFASVTRRLDFATCAIWFATGVLLSPQRMTDALDTYYSAGAPFISPALLRGVQQVALGLAVAVSCLFLANYIWMWIRGKRPNPVKLALLITSISFWWYCNNIVASILVGVALFEVFHDVQYLSLVWIYNRKRVEKDSSIGGFMRFVFRRSGSLVGLYIGLIFAYGALGYFKLHFELDAIKRILTGVVTASGLLHFYYDGFIWKVRESSMRESLGIAGGTADISLSGFLPSWAMHGAKWAAAFVIPLGAFWLGQTRTHRSDVERTAQIAADLPVGGRQHINYATALQEAGRIDEAAEEFTTALRYNPNSAKAHASLAAILIEKEKLDEAENHFQAASRAEPNNAEFHSGHAFVLERLGRDEEAAAECEAAIRVSPKSALPWYSYGAFLEKHRKLDEAIAQYRRAIQIDPRFVDAHIDLGTALLEKGDLQEGKLHYQQATRLAPKLAQPHYYLGKIFLRTGDVHQAIAHFEEALRLHPDFPEAEQDLRFARASDH
jgi:tetratricopeptide (TPR) repeat protein